MKYVESLLDLIGDTPLVRLDRSLDLPSSPDARADGAAHGPRSGPLLLAKVEYLNPGGSVKDRIATRMIEAAEASGALQPGGTIVEPTSGNTGVGLAMVAQQKGYKCVFVCPDKVSEDKRNVLKAYGAEVVVCPTAVAPEHPDSYYNVSDRLASQPGAWKPDQYSNPHNPRSHYETTGPEIWEQTDGRITHFVAGVGTGGTISGIGRYLKEQAALVGKDVQIIGADPAGSVYSGGSGRPYLVEGVGEDFWPETYDRSIADRIIEVSDADSFAFTRRLAREEAMLVGGSSGMAAYAARQLVHELAAEGRDDAVVVVLLPDSGRGYLTKVFNDAWLSQYGFATEGGSELRTVGEVLRGKSGRLPDLVHTHPSETIAEAVHILQEYGVSQMPVVRAEPPIVAAEVAGSVSERDLLDALFTGKATLTDPVEDHMSPPLPSIGSTSPAREAVAMLETADAALVHEDGKPVGVLTRQDLLAHLAKG
ncbi:cystathionine beta-synthase [Nocardioides sp. P5_C9_2]